MAHADFAQSLGMRDQLGNELFGWCCGKFGAEFNDQQVGHTEITNQSDFMLSSGQQMRCFLRAEHLRRMRIERYHNRCSISRMSMARGSGNDSPMSEVHAVEDADGEKERATELR